MKKTKSMVMVLVDGEVVERDLSSIHDAEQAIEKYMDENDVNLDNTNFEIVQYLMSLSSADEDFRVAENKGDLELGEEAVGSVDTVYKINEGSYRGETFDSLDDLQSFLQEKMSEGELDEDEVRELSITKTDLYEVSFDDAECESSTYEVKLQLGSDANDEVTKAFGALYVLASEVENTEEPESYGSILGDIRPMTDKEIADELVKLYRRTSLLQLELENRREAVNTDNEADTF